MFDDRFGNVSSYNCVHYHAQRSGLRNGALNAAKQTQPNEKEVFRGVTQFLIENIMELSDFSNPKHEPLIAKDLATFLLF